jgi:hypothetical protein
MHNIQWERLLREFETYDVEPDCRQLSSQAFAQSLIDPPPQFASVFLTRKSEAQFTRDEAVRALYCFLLQKRYEERVNLLHFAFHIFDEKTRLPQEIIDRTPFPHEDGVPSFRHINDPGFTIIFPEIQAVGQ